MEIYLTHSLLVEAAGFVVGSRTESAIFTGGRVLIEIKLTAPPVYCPLLLESELYSISKVSDLLRGRGHAGSRHVISVHDPTHFSLSIPVQ